MSIGVFDSGVGGLSVHRALVDAMPAADFIYLGDHAHSPYGGRSGEEIVELTRLSCERLFADGVDLVVLACNTASAIALRRLQQTWLPGYRQALGRMVNVLGIIVPTIEAATGQAWAYEPERRGEKVQAVEVIGVFSTPATTRSRVYEIEIDKRREDIAVFSQPCPDLVPMIEGDASENELKAVIEGYVRALTTRIGRTPDRAILGCTHYQIVADLFAQALPHGLPLIHQPSATVDALQRYLKAHPEYRPGQSGERRFLTTGRPAQQNAVVESFWGGPLKFDLIGTP